ncbi:MotA/TolQ/ExbB proton channel family protein [Desulfobacca acetoxidans]|uniref:MotA/TolQ/ExbB proton channel n=1 Tax=Desulfobacca acetoxidans (strain ATCC 700848 / DSM 11109 / ASRB2) TaxID=880072 RepID=F2NEP5_DESAR|nr:MotA/TolQ/ExbB proton channel family protein [Desulfobacca acetoxidans]AEB08235.1 MotA/TolQ/ExbB proton channel [Desulfobacca acetoxidans DSM 11109]HAY21690.1 MotA/TolQ/ExbB proton channel family protein [Desulfobacterales bacterium]
MNIMAGLETFLYVISSALFYPVVVGLILLTFWIVISFGSFLREYLDRRQGGSRSLQQYRRMLDPQLITRSANLDLELEKRLQEAELELIKGLDKIRFAIRVGPAVGLMGTLIPMGISLAALAQGDMPKMAGSMVTAFTATVVGLACGVAAYLMSLVREKWVRADMREMEYLTEMRLRKGKGPRTEDKGEGDNEPLKKTATV